MVKATLPCLTVCVFAVFTGSFSTVARGQSDLGDAHIVPGPSAPMVKPRSPLSIIKKNVDLVLVPVTITDTMDRLVTGLAKDNFRLFENRKPQEIQNFSDEDTAVSVGIILDMSGSMSSKVDRAREALLDFCNDANAEDEFFLITFSDRAELVEDFTTHTEDVQSKLLSLAPKGRTALLDAVYLGLAHMQHARYGRRALFIISDGGDNHSRFTESEVKAQAREADVSIYAVGVFDRYFATTEEAEGPLLLESLAQVTGGQSYTVDNPNVLPAIAERISIELRRQYLISYRPENTPHDGKWHQIRIKLKLPKGLPPLLVRAKQGYYAPSR
jgi:Ca-activated chloride channel homolog